MEKIKNELQEHWFSSMMREDGVIMIKINNEVYSNHIAQISNLHYEEENQPPVFDIVYDDETLYDDEAYNTYISKAVGEILISAIQAEQVRADTAMALASDYFIDNLFKLYNISVNSELSYTQLFKMNDLFPIPVINDEEKIFADNNEIEDYINNIKWDSEFSIYDIKENKEYSLKTDKDKEIFINLVKSRLSEYLK